MLGFNYDSFKEAIKKVEQENYARLMSDIEKVKAFVEKALAMFLESNTNMTQVRYPSIGL
ncbi:MAG: hypothetical protein WCG95_01900 [bacterium]